MNAVVGGSTVELIANVVPWFALFAAVILMLMVGRSLLNGEGREALLGAVGTVVMVVVALVLPRFIRSQSPSAGSGHDEPAGQGEGFPGLDLHGVVDAFGALPGIVWLVPGVIVLGVLLWALRFFSNRAARDRQELFAQYNEDCAAALSATADTARRHLQPTETEETAGSSAAAPVASRERGQAVWEEAMAQEGRILRKWQEYRSSVDMVLAYPSLSKLDDPLAVAASRAMLKTKRLRAAAPPDPDGDPTTWAYVNAVDDLQHAFDLAVASARKRSAFSRKERELLDTALTVLTTIRTTTNPAEEAVNKRKLKKLMEDLPLDMPEAAMLALEAETRLQLTMGIDRRDKDLDFSLLSGGGPGSSAVAV